VLWLRDTFDFLGMRHRVQRTLRSECSLTPLSRAAFLAMFNLVSHRNSLAYCPKGWEIGAISPLISVSARDMVVPVLIAAGVVAC